jgi:uncharacterized membrane protein HdeD (DUF308 family)
VKAIRFLARLIAGISFILIGVLATAAYFNVATTKMVVAMLGLPPLISGILFLIGWRRSRSPRT